MTITTTKLTRAAGLAAVAAGLLFIAVQIKHPELDPRLRPEHAVDGAPEHEDRRWPSCRWSASPGCTCARCARSACSGWSGWLAVQPGLPDHAERRGRSAWSSCRPSPRSSPELRQRRPRRGHQRQPTGDIGLISTLNRRRRRRLPHRRAALRHRPVPRRRPRPVGRRPARGRRRRHPRHPLAAAGQPAAVRRSHRHRPDRSRLLAVARAAYRGRRARAQHRRLAGLDPAGAR